MYKVGRSIPNLEQEEFSLDSSAALTDKLVNYPQPMALSK